MKCPSWWPRRWSKDKSPRLELRFVTYEEAEKLIQQGHWSIAEEEDNNKVIGMVYLERREN